MQRSRDPFFDNAKLILIFLVVFGHLLEQAEAEYLLPNFLFLLIYSFHMPAFAFITGYFSKNLTDPLRVAKVVKRLLIPYAVFECLYIVVSYFLKDSVSLLELVRPTWYLWFLLALSVWRLVLPYFVKLPLAFFVALFLALIVGIVPNGLLFNLSRTVVFFPYFLLGFYVQASQLQRLQVLKRKPVFHLLMGLLVLLLLMLSLTFSSFWFYGSFTYGQFGLSYILGMMLRLFTYVLSGLMVTWFLTLVPHKRFLFTQRGLYVEHVYVLHGFFILLLSALGFFDWLTFSTWPILLLLLLAFAIVWACTSFFVVTFLKPLLSPSL